MSELKIFYFFVVVTVILYLVLLTPSSNLEQSKVIYNSLILPLLKHPNSSLEKVRLHSEVLTSLNEYAVNESENSAPIMLSLKSSNFQNSSKNEIQRKPLNKLIKTNTFKIENKQKRKSNSKLRTLTIFEQIRMASLKVIPENDCSSPFVTIIKSGRLGNKICQLMTLLLLRQYFGIRIAVFPVMLDHLNSLFENVSVPTTSNPCFYPDQTSYFEGNSHVLFNILFIQLVKKEETTSFLHKNYSTEMKHYNYISNHARPFINNILVDRRVLKSRLKIRKHFIIRAKNRIEQAMATTNFNRNNTTLISVHVRRTDYLLYAQNNNSTLPKVSFYKKAMEFFRKRCYPVLFLVVSDDKEWVETWLSAPDVVFPGDFDICTPQTDFTILTLCDHHIIGLGTFAYSSALLGRGTIVSFTNQKIPSFWTEDVPDSCNLPQDIIHMND